METNSRVKSLASMGLIQSEDIIDRTSTDNFPANAITVRMKDVGRGNLGLLYTLEVKQSSITALREQVGDRMPKLRESILGMNIMITVSLENSMVN